MKKIKKMQKVLSVLMIMYAIATILFSLSGQPSQAMFGAGAIFGAAVSGIAVAILGRK